MNRWAILGVIAIILIGFGVACQNRSPAWTSQNIETWLQTCQDVTFSEFEDEKGGNFSQESSKAYCDCYFKDLQDKKILPKDEASYIGTPQWKEMSDRCYKVSLKK